MGRRRGWLWRRVVERQSWEGGEGDNFLSFIFVCFCKYLLNSRLTHYRRHGGRKEGKKEGEEGEGEGGGISR